jgi:hypothetical protein
VQGAPQANAGGELRPDGTFAPGARTIQAAGARATAGKTRLAAKLGLAKLPDGDAFAPYRRAAAIFRRVQCADRSAVPRRTNGSVPSARFSMRSAPMRVATSVDVEPARRVRSGSPGRWPMRRWIRAPAVGIGAAGSLLACLQPAARSPATVQYECNKRLSEALDDEKAAIVWLRCEDALPRYPCGLLADEFVRGFPDAGPLVEFVAGTCHESVHDELSEGCMTALKAAFFEKLGRRYYRATSSQVESRCNTEKLPCNLRSLASLQFVELLFMESHNDLAKAEHDATIQHLETQCDADVTNAEKAAQASEGASTALAAMAAGLQSFGSHLQTATTESNSPTVTPVATCASDFQCPFGSYCVKAQFAASGSCARVVNSYGGPTLAPPRIESVGPGGAQCTFTVGECPIGFQCINNHCMR